MVGEWQSTRLVDIAESIQTGPFGSQLHASDYTETGTPVVMPTNIKDRRINPAGIVFIGDGDAARLSRHQLQLNDLVFSRRGEVDKCALTTQTNVGWLCGTGCLLVRPDPTKCDAAFLSYHISAPETREWLRSHAVGLVMPNLNTEILGNIPLRMPSLIEQRKIANLLGSLDEKIEVNHKTSAVLEEIARALFKSWFVDFQPVRDKSVGRSTGLPEDIAALFPSRFNDSGLPEGWTLHAFGDLYDVRSGNTPSTAQSDFWGSEHLWATPRDLSRLQAPILLKTERQLTDAGLAQSNSGLLPINSVLLSTRAPIGYLAMAASPVAINQGMAGIVGKEFSTSYAWLWCQQNVSTFVSVAGGSTFPEISKGTLRSLPMLRATDAVLGAFCKQADELTAQIFNLAREIETLEGLRDALLPKLISGELRIDGIRQTVVAA